MPNVQAKHFCFTANNTALGDLAATMRAEFESARITYCVMQQERGGTTGTLHVQGYISFPRRLRTNFQSLQALVPGCHIEVARGSAAANRAYCTKAETRVEGTEPFEVGTPPRDGSGNLVQEQLASFKTSCNDLDRKKEDIEDEHLLVMAKYPKFAGEIIMRREHRQAQQLSARNLPYVIWIWGFAGYGKTMRAKEIAREKGLEYWILDDTGANCTWWDGYYGQPCVIVDDVTEKWISLDYLKSLCDKSRETRCQIKGRMGYVLAELVILTSVADPADYFRSEELDRRIDCKYRLTERWTPPAPAHAEAPVIVLD